MDQKNGTNLYLELTSNPYTPRALQLIAEKFPDVNAVAIIRKVVLSEPKGIYDRNFNLLSTAQQEEELSKQKENVIEISKRLVAYCEKHAGEFKWFSREVVYNRLAFVVFGTVEVKEIEQKYAHNQRRGFRLAIVNLIEEISTSDSTGKKSARLHSATVVGVTLLLIPLLYLTQRTIQITTHEQKTESNILAIETQQQNKVFPVRLKIPSIDVDATIEHMGTTSEGEMQVPSTTVDVGWYKLGPLPGENGSAVIAGHFDGKNGEAGVFATLDKLRRGDKIYITNGYGKTVSFIVQKSRTYDPGYAEEVFSKNDNAHLNLITCDGAWNKAEKSYTKRLVVFSDIER